MEVMIPVVAFISPVSGILGSLITLTFPITSKASEGTVVPTPTSPFALTNKLSLST